MNGVSTENKAELHDAMPVKSPIPEIRFPPAGQHIALIRLHNFPRQREVLDAVAACVEGIICVTNPGTTEDVRKIAAAHPAVIELWHDPQPWTQAGSYTRAFDHLKQSGRKIRTLFYLDHDELPPANFLAERDEFLKSDCGYMEFHYVFPWENLDTIVHPGVGARSGPLAKLVKWHDRLGWEPYLGFCVPQNAGKAFTCRYPMRHASFMLPEWRKAKIRGPALRGYPDVIRWVSLENPPTLPYDARPWDEWAALPKIDVSRLAAMDLFDVACFDGIESATLPSAPAVAESIVRHFAPASVVDVGCGTGVYLEQLQRLGVEVFGVENAAAAAQRARIPRDRIGVHDLRRPLSLDRRFNLAISFEVAEHLDPNCAEQFVKSLCALSDTVLFSAAGPGQGGVGHINEQPWEYWLSLFWQCGYELDATGTAGLRAEWSGAGAPFWLRENTAVLSRSACPPDALARVTRLLSRVEGWLDPVELQFLFAAARQVPKPAAIVEIGSWKGRSTAALALGAAAGEGARVFAVDHHHGDPATAHACGVGMMELSSWREFQANLQALHVQDAVTPIVKDSLAAEAAWDGPPIDLLFMDADQEHESVSGDFRVWSRHVRPGGIVAFHGAADQAGPNPVAGEALAQGRLRNLVRIGSITYGLATGARAETGKSSQLPPRLEKRDRVSIVIVTRNEGEHLRKTIDSLLRNAFYPDYEVLILDDASEDDSCDFLFVSPYAQDRRLRYVRYDTQKGYLALRNEAAKLATGPVLVHLGAHHCFRPCWLGNLRDSLRRRGDQAVVGPAVCALDAGAWVPTGEVRYGFTSSADLARTAPLQGKDLGPDCRTHILSGHQMMFTREIFEAVGGYSPLFEGHGAEDVEFSLRAFLLGYDCHVEPSAIIAHLDKRSYMNHVTWAHLAYNRFVMIHALLGEEGWNRLKPSYQSHAGYAAGLEKYEHRRDEIERHRQWIVRRQRRSGEELLAHLASAGPAITGKG